MAAANLVHAEGVYVSLGGMPILRDVHVDVAAGEAVALIGAGRPDDAVTLIRQIQDKDGVSQALRLRLSEMMIALGETPEPTE